MRISLRHRAPGELDHELIWLAVSVSSLAIAGIWFALGLPWPRCIFHDLTGWPCPSCGMTRAATEFMRGHLPAAFRWNPLVFSSLCALTIFNLYASLVLVAGRRRVRIALVTRGERNLMRAVIVGLLALNWLYLLVANPGI
jgi:hypothetical protein